MIEHLIPIWVENHKIESWAAVGSRVTCDPAPTGTDADFLILLTPGVGKGEAMDKYRAELECYGWQIGGSLPLDADDITYPPEERFVSFTRGEANLIVTESREFFQRFICATALAKKQNLMDKADRIELFQAVLYAATKAPLDVHWTPLAGLYPKSQPDFDELLDELV